MRLVDEHVDQTSLAVMQMAHDDYVPHHLGSRRQSEQESTQSSTAGSLRDGWNKSDKLVIPRLVWPCALADAKLAVLDGLDDGLRDGLSVFFLDHRLDVGAVQSLSRLVVCFIIV